MVEEDSRRATPRAHSDLGKLGLKNLARVACELRGLTEELYFSACSNVSDAELMQ
jgi:hypothetical protein